MLKNIIVFILIQWYLYCPCTTLFRCILSHHQQLKVYWFTSNTTKRTLLTCVLW